MSRIIADVYEIEQEIGSGGGGVVYLAKHMRLNKQVVLKGDKRSLTAKQDSLRREVDSLKNLSHTYIPQVYDYVSDDDMVYTVMDYVEGVSLNKALEYGERYEQARIIKWACQLLEAVAYLHKQPPYGILHADIKPANIMLTPQDDIKLIDYNIALLLGEDGAIAVGKSYGYASPEHYGIDHSSGHTTHSETIDDSGTKIATENDVKTVVDGQYPANVSLSSGSNQKKRLDVRSDIYSIGATLYHLLTGRRPERDEIGVAPILRQHCSPALAVIVEKAMNPNSDLRYQSADDMLNDIRHLRDNDPRVKRWKRTRDIACVILALTFLAGSASVFVGNRQMERVRREEAEQLRLTAEQERKEEETRRLEAESLRGEEEKQRNEAEKLRRLEEMRVLAAKSADALRSDDRLGAIAFALDAVPSVNDIGIEYIAEAKKALADALGVYDLSDGFKPHWTVTLPSEAIDIAIAPDGRSFAAISLGKLSVFDTESGALLDELPAIESGLADIKYIDSNTIVYAALNGLTKYDLALKSAARIGAEATTIAVSADSNVIASVNRDSTLASVYRDDANAHSDVAFGNRRMWVATNDRFGDPGVNIFELNDDGSLLAVSFSNGGLEIFNTADSQGYIEIFDKSDYTHFEGGFHDKYFAFSAANTEESLFAVIDTQKLEMTISTTLPGFIGTSADADGIYMSYNGTYVSIDPITAKQTPLSYNPGDQIAEGYRVDGNLNSPIVHISKYESHGDKTILTYDLDYAHDEARLNAGKNRAMLFSFENFRIYNADGGLVNESRIPNAGQVYDQQYRRDGDASYLEVIYYDGTIHKYSGADGALIANESISPPDPSLYEEFTTENLLIKSPLHGTPTAYDAMTGDAIRELEKDAYLTYVTQAGVYVITEYISAYGERYGLLLDGKTCETLAYIPNLCDVINDKLIIDDQPSGSLREIRLYSLEELIEMARIALNII